MNTLVAALLASVAWSPGGSERFIPPTLRDGDRTVVPLVFTDGTRVTLTYPSRLRLAELGVEPYTWGSLPAVQRDFQIRYGRLGRIAEDWDWTLLRRYGRASYWDPGVGWGGNYYLAFQFGRWVVLVYDNRSGAAAMTERQKWAWARLLRGWETRRGFLRLGGRGRLRIVRAGEYELGPQIAFGPNQLLTLHAVRCRRTFHHDRRMYGHWVSWNRRHASWCLSRSMRANAHGSPRFMRALIRSVSVIETGLHPARMRTCVRALGWSDRSGR